MIIDTHSHLNFKAYEKDKDKVLKRTLESGIWMINVGTKFETSRSAVELAEKYEQGVYAAIGMHPIFASAEFQKIKTDPEEGEFLIKEENFEKEKYSELAKSKKVVAIGEIGLDYYYKPKTKTRLEEFKSKQKEIFQQQLDLAREFDLPVIVHCRMAHEDILKILNSQIAVTYKKVKGVVHCFTGTLDEAKQYAGLGFYIGVNGIIFKYNIDDVIREIPLDKILVETDCPYLTPPQEGKDTRNEPIFIKHVIQKIADLKGTGFEDVAGKTAENARNLFKI